MPTARFAHFCARTPARAPRAVALGFAAYFITPGLLPRSATLPSALGSPALSGAPRCAAFPTRLLRCVLARTLSRPRCPRPAAAPRAHGRPTRMEADTLYHSRSSTFSFMPGVERDVGQKRRHSSPKEWLTGGLLSLLVVLPSSLGVDIYWHPHQAARGLPVTSERSGRQPAGGGTAAARGPRKQTRKQVLGKGDGDAFCSWSRRGRGGEGKESGL